ncbi:MAG: sodium-dependent bicarbonate transport family permease [Cryomorphaceae bacterium]|nr:sodium-dependent bicarbonate transport family permease [Cryomorphaceae bacterium]
MPLDLLIDNLTNPALLLFLLGILAVQLKSDLSIPENSSKFISIYLLFAIGFKGGHELAHSTLDMEVFATIIFALAAASLVPVLVFFIVRRRFSTANAAAVAAAYGSVSAVTFVTAITYLERQDITFGGHMVAILAIMEVPAIVVGVLLLRRYDREELSMSFGKVLHHALTNGSVMLILGSLVVGYLANDVQAEEIKPFTTDIFKGFLAIFLLDMGIHSGKRLNAFFRKGAIATVYAVIIPLVNGCITAWVSHGFISGVGDRFMLAILAASASYIAVPAAMKMAAPKANPGIYLPMALAITFPVNITLGMPLYFAIASM